MKNTKQLITDAKDVHTIASRLREEKMIGVDTEFIRETTFYPKVALLQVATDKEAWLIDPTVLNKKMLEPLFDVFLDKSILKIMHAAYADQECLYWAYGFLAEPVIDTAVAAALCGMGDNVGLGKLLRDVCRVSLPKGRARAKWLVRPLSHELMVYAEEDVSHLVQLTRTLLDRLEKKSRVDWAMEESVVRPEVFEVSPEDMAKRIAKNGQIDVQAFGVLVELLRWREDRARTANLPRGWVADNDILIALSKVRPSTIEDLRGFRGLNGKELERSGKQIIDAVNRGKSRDRNSLDMPERPPPSPEREDHVLEFVRTYVSYLADKHEIALRFLINTSKAVQLIQQASGGEDVWIKEGILSRRACALIGKDLMELLKGRRGLALKNGRVEILSLAGD